VSAVVAVDQFKVFGSLNLKEQNNIYSFVARARNISVLQNVHSSPEPITQDHVQ